MAAVTGAKSRPPTSSRQTANRWSAWLSPWYWTAPAIILVGVLLVYPVIYTVWLSLRNSDSSQFVGLGNFAKIFTDRSLLEILRNNGLWLVLGTIATVGLGLLIAVLADRARFERVSKATIFIPMAISMVGAGVIWKFVYQYAPAGQPQVGLLDAVRTRLGFPPVAWLINTNLNNFALIAAYVWMWTGFCLVILSAALKNVPDDVLEAARVDGANEIQIFARIIVPLISPTIAVVTTVMIVNILKIFDIIYVMSGGDFGTNVIAMAYYQQLFDFNNFGLASAFAVLLLIAIVPVLLFNISRFRAQEAQR